METINHECYVSLEVAKLLKEAGFDWEGTAYYQHGVFYPYSVDRERLVVMNQSSAPSYMEQYSAPTLDVAQRWLREVKNISVDIVSNKYGYFEFRALYINVPDNTIFSYICASECKYYTYEQAQESGEKKALEIILEKGE